MSGQPFMLCKKQTVVCVADRVPERRGWRPRDSAQPGGDVFFRLRRVEFLVDLTIPSCLSQKLPNDTGVVNETRVSWEVSGLLLGGEPKGWAL